MRISASEAAKRTGKSVPTITRAIKSGKISAGKSDSGSYLIDPSELFRVFPAVTPPNDATTNMLGHETPDVTPDETRLLQEKVSSLEASLAEAKAERDEWRDQAKRLAMALPAPEPVEKTLQEKPINFWKCVFGKSDRGVR